MAPIITPVGRNYEAELQQKQQILGDIGSGINQGIQAGMKLRDEMKKADFINNLLVDLHKHHPEEQFVLPQGTTPEEAVALVKHYETSVNYKNNLEEQYGVKLPPPKLGMDATSVKTIYDGIIKGYNEQQKGVAVKQAAQAKTQGELSQISAVGAAQIPTEMAKRAGDIEQKSRDQIALEQVDEVVNKLKATGKKFYRNDILKMVGPEVAQSPAVLKYTAQFGQEPPPMTPYQGINLTGDAIKDAKAYSAKAQTIFMKGQSDEGPVTIPERVRAYSDKILYDQASRMHPADMAAVQDYITREESSPHGKELMENGAARLMLNDIGPTSDMTQQEFETQIQQYLPSYQQWIESPEKFKKLVSGLMGDKTFKAEEPNRWAILNKIVGFIKSVPTKLSTPPTGTIKPVSGSGIQPKPLSANDQKALDWANANPNDPRAAQIKQRLGR